MIDTYFSPRAIEVCVLRKLQAMSDKEQCLMPLVPEQAAILEKFGSGFCHAVSVRFKCTAILHNLEDAGSFGSNTSGVWRAEKRYSTKLSSGVEVSVWKDDLTRHKVEAVVNAANEKLNHGGGLAQALSVAGGPMIQKWSDHYIQEMKSVKTGDAVLGPAGYLPCKYIIHAVGPKVPQNPSQKETDNVVHLLYNAINSILHIVVNENIPSVAIPALSSGLFNFPRDLCADIIVKAIKQFHENGGFQGKNLEIHLVNNDEPSVLEMERATRAMSDLPSTPGSYSGKGRNQSMTSSSSSGFQFGNVTLHLKKGYIEEEKADVIVNTIATNRDLSKGEISKAILKKAGRGIQDQISKIGNSISFSGGELYFTNAHGLSCQSVYHIALTHTIKKTLYNSVSECLRRAAWGYTSISFPAIGTGNLGFQKRDVAEIMMEAVAEFSKQCMKKLDVYFVVFPKDKGMMEAFENEMKQKKGAAKYPEVHNNMPTSFTSAAKETTANETPTVEFYSSSNEALREAKEWAINMLKPSTTKTIKNNHVIHFGQEDHEYLLSLQIMLNVRIEEFFRNGKGGITITGNPSDVSCAAIEVENMLCKAQEDFAQAEERDMLYSVVRWSCKDVPWIQTPEISAILEKAYLAGMENHVFNNHKFNLKSMTVIDNTGGVSIMRRTCLLTHFESLNNSFYARTPVRREECFDKEERKALEDIRHHIVKVEKLENVVLKQLFEMNRQRVKDKPKRLYQRVSAQFCDLICRVGFQKEFAPPAEQKYGSGIYFSTVDEALKLWNEEEHEEYIYIIQAQVLTGNSTDGSPQLILPPHLGKDPLDHYDSVNHKKQTYVIFSSQQALPEYLIICGRSTRV